MILFIGGYICAVNYNFFGLFGSMPSLEILENPKSEVASELISSDGVMIGKYFIENRSPVEYEQISPNLIKALLATEDIRFEEHSGIDMKGIFAIAFYLIKGDNRGSSTLSQQLAKNLFSTRSEKYEGILSANGLMRKVIIKTKEWITAIKIERAYTKKEIITMYLNTVDFGSNAFGIKVAAQTFFGTTTDSLSITQSAVLVGVLKAPSLYSPIYNPVRSLLRRNTVLEQMEKYKYITNEEKNTLRESPLNLKYNVENHNQGIATYFRTVVNNYLLNWCKEHHYSLYSDGLKIYTTLDSRLQMYAEKAVENHMKYIQSQFYLHWAGKNPWVDETAKEIPNFIENATKRTDTYRYLKEKFNANIDSVNYYMNLKKKMKVFAWSGERDTIFSSVDSITYYKKFLNTGLLSVEPETGHIKAWVGGINHKFFKFDHVKQSKRQPGSTFKPFIYAAAMDNGYSPCYKVKDEPVSFYDEFSKTSYTPQNADGPSTGEILTLRQALSRSVNTVAAYLIKKLSPQTIVDYTKRLGIKGDLQPTPSLTYGVADVSIYELVGAFSTFANRGTYTEPIFITRIEDKNGNIIQEIAPKREEVLNEETAYTMLYMLRGATELKGGTGMGLRRYQNLWSEGNEIGGKTGTTQNSSDGWFVGVNQNLVSAVWVGGDDRSIHFRDLQFGQGSKLALPIFGLYMDAVYADPNKILKKSPFKKPARYAVQLDCSKYTNSEPVEVDSLEKSPHIYKSDNNLDGI
ncbi:MAG: penicillin-binding protein 1A [Cytophagales bacterium]